jgi:serine/threonine protein phosphatase PrpC
VSEQGVRLVDATRTDVGKVRDHNEDSFISRPEAGLWAVADGMGGYERGEWASAVITDALKAIPMTGDFSADAGAVANAIHAANRTIYVEASRTGQQMGSTVVALFVSGKRFAVLWAGDSRCYLLRDGELHRLSKDHSQVQEMVDQGLLTPEEASHHPMSNVLSRAAGVESWLQLDAIADEVEVGDIFLLCSDGLHGQVSDAEIGLTLGMDQLQSACDRLVDMTLARGAPDNVTLVAIACEEVTRLNLVPSQPVG